LGGAFCLVLQFLVCLDAAAAWPITVLMLNMLMWQGSSCHWAVCSTPLLMVLLDVLYVWV
jgi:hypothetical protein